MTAGGTLHVITPIFEPVGGVVKLMDYATHALALGLDVSVQCPFQREPGLPLFEIARFAELRPENPRVDFHSSSRLDLRENDLVFLSLPSDYELAYRSLPRGMSPERIIHIIQNVRHVNPDWLGGYPLRLLSRPAARISTNEIVAQSIADHLDSRALHEVIPLGHETGYFHREPGPGLSRPIRVAYTTWKSDVGDRVREACADSRFTFRAVRQSVSWAALRDLYHWADIFLCTPNFEEGFYMPGLEAMEAGCLVITPDVGGNMAYCKPDENCLLVGYEDVPGYIAALNTVANWSAELVTEVRAAARAAIQPFDLDRERGGFARYLERLWIRIFAAEKGDGAPGSAG